MGIDVESYRARIGAFIRKNSSNGESEKRLRTAARLKKLWIMKYCIIQVSPYSNIESVHYPLKPLQGQAVVGRRAGKVLLMMVVASVVIVPLLLIMSGDVEENPGPLEDPLDFKCSEEHIYEISTFSFDWKMLGRRLIGSQAVKDIGREEHSEQNKRDKMFEKWLELKGSKATYRVLIEALQRIKNVQAAEAVQKLASSPCHAPPQSVSTNPVPALVESHQEGLSLFTTKLKERYKNHKPAQVDFPPVPTYSFTNLALVKDTTETHRGDFFYNTIQGSMDDVIETKAIISYKELMNSITPDNRIILLEGRPGCGKTTLMRKLSKDWGEGAVLTFIKYLFLIPLRQFYTTPITSVSDILKYFIEDDELKLYDGLELEIKKKLGQGVCFVFDGLDEYSQMYTKDGCSWFEKLLRGISLTSSTVIITSRPNASLELRRSVHTRGEVLGFLKEQIDQYIDTSYPINPSKASEVKAYLHDNQNIRHMCYVPLHLVMIIFIYDTSQEEATPLPDTETEVYHQFTIMSLVRYFRKVGKKITLKNLELLPTPESVLFREISKHAYTTTAASKTSISSEVLMSLGGEWSTTDIANLGILVMDEKEERSGAKPIFSFVHLTNQEFLAAYHVSRLPPDEQLKAIREHVVQPHMAVVLKFFCGLSRLQNDDHWSVIMNSALIDVNSYGDNKKVNLRALHCVYESQNDQRCKELFTKVDGKLVIKNEILTLLDYCAIGYCIRSAINLLKEIVLNYCQLTAEGLDIITMKLTNTMDSVITLTMIGNDLYDKDILVAVKKFISKCPNVESLDLSWCFNKRGCSDWSLLVDIIKKTPHLKALKLFENSIGAKGMEVLCANSSHFSSLTNLDLSKNWIGAEGMEVLCASSSHFSSLTNLNLCRNDIGAKGMKALCAASSNFSSLTNLDVRRNKLGDESIQSLVLIINQCPLKELELYGNYFSDEGAQLLEQKAKALRPGIEFDV